MITRTPETEEHYRQIARRLMQTCGRDLGRHSSELTVAMMAGWMIQHRTEWASATWRQYRAALDFVTGSQLSGIPSRSELPPPAPRDERTSGLKEKRLPPDDLQKLLDYLLDEAKRRPRQSSNGISTRGMATLLLLCGTITGLRHCEWVSVVVTPPALRADLAHPKCKEHQWPQPR